MEIDKIYIITLPQCNRYKKLLQQLIDLNIAPPDKIEIFYSNPLPKSLQSFATQSIHNDYYDILIEKGIVDDNVYLKVMSCSLAHYNICKIAKELHYNKIMILEDDTEFLDNYELIRNTFENIPEESYVFKFAFDSESVYQDKIAKSDNGTNIQEYSNDNFYGIKACSGGYVLNKHGIDKFVFLYNYNLYNADDIFRHAQIYYPLIPIIKIHTHKNSVIESYNIKIYD